MSDQTAVAPDGRLVLFPEEFAACTVPVLGNEYLVPDKGVIPDEPEMRSVLDLGAGVGAFSAWARHRWPGCSVVAVEPDPFLAGYLRRNVPEAAVVEAAVTARDAERMALHRGPNGHYGYNTTEPELTGNPSGSVIEVRALRPAALPAADVIKLDVEGAEMCVLDGWPHLERAWWVVLEWHSGQQRPKLEDILIGAGLRLVAGRVIDMEAGLQVWCRTRSRVNRGAWRYEL